MTFQSSNGKPLISAHSRPILPQSKNYVHTHFLATSQSDFLRRCKIELRYDTALKLLDLAEKFKSAIQDEVLGFHWTNLQCTLHPVLVYYKFNGEICHKWFYLLSDDTLHDVNNP